MTESTSIFNLKTSIIYTFALLFISFSFFPDTGRAQQSQNKVEPTQIAEEDESFLEDPNEEEEDESFLEDPNEEDDPEKEAINEVDQSSETETSLLDEIKIEHRYIIKGETLEANRGFSTGEKPAEEESDSLHNTYRLNADLQATQNWSFHLQFALDYEYAQDKIKEKDEGESTGTLEEIYLTYRNQSHLLIIGEKPIEVGTLDSSPMDILQQSELHTGTNLAPTVYYRWGVHPISLHLYWNPIYRPTEAQQDTLDEDNGIDDTRPTIRSYYGWRLGWSTSGADMKLGFFRWFDQDSEVTTQRIIIPATTLGGTNTEENISFEKESEVEFASFEMDWSFSDYVWRVETIYFQNKNVYDFKVLSEEEQAVLLTTIPPPTQVIAAEINTLSLDQVVFASTIERVIDDWVIMPGVLFRDIRDVPENTNIAYYENERTPKTETRNITRTDWSLFIKYNFNDDFNTSLNLLETTPFAQTQVANKWTWKTWKFQIVRSESEKLFATGKRLKNNSASLSYEYEF